MLYTILADVYHSIHQYRLLGFQVDEEHLQPITFHCYLPFLIFSMSNQTQLEPQL